MDLKTKDYSLGQWRLWESKGMEAKQMFLTESHTTPQKESKGEGGDLESRPGLFGRRGTPSSGWHTHTISFYAQVHFLFISLMFWSDHKYVSIWNRVSWEFGVINTMSVLLAFAWHLVLTHVRVTVPCSRPGGLCFGFILASGVLLVWH